MIIFKLHFVSYCFVLVHALFLLGKNLFISVAVKSIALNYMLKKTNYGKKYEIPVALTYFTHFIQVLNLRKVIYATNCLILRLISLNKKNKYFFYSDYQEVYKNVSIIYQYCLSIRSLNFWIKQSNVLKEYIAALCSPLVWLVGWLGFIGTKSFWVHASPKKGKTKIELYFKSCLKS